MTARAGDIIGYHAHIYYDPQTRESAARVREALGQFDVRLGRWHDRPVGPHPKSMYQVVFTPEELEAQNDNGRFMWPAEEFALLSVEEVIEVEEQKIKEAQDQLEKLKRRLGR